MALAAVTQVVPLSNHCAQTRHNIQVSAGEHTPDVPTRRELGRGRVWFSVLCPHQTDMSPHHFHHFTTRLLEAKKSWSLVTLGKAGTSRVPRRQVLSCQAGQADPLCIPIPLPRKFPPC